MGLGDSDPHTMSLPEEHPSQTLGSRMPLHHQFSLPELYASAENFNNESKKSNFQNSAPPPLRKLGNSSEKTWDRRADSYANAPFRKRLPSHTFRKLLLASVTPDKLVFEDKSMRFFSLEPGKQFLDLVDLEWRYFNGLAKWGHIPRKFSFMDIKYNTEKRFVESQGMPGPVFPPLVRKTLVIYPQLDYHEEGHYSLKWNV